MQKRIFNLLFWGFFLTVSVYFGVVFLQEIYCYSKLDKKVDAKVGRWEVLELNNGKFAIAAEFSYEVKGTKFIRQTKFLKTLFLNQPSSITFLKSQAKKNWKTWYSSKDPSYASLQKKFPHKSLNRWLVSLGVLVYFFWFKKFFEKKYS
jgi:hypothetical protein